MADSFAFAWCPDHGRLHNFSDGAWCTAWWVPLTGSTEDEALAHKQDVLGSAVFYDQLPLEVQERLASRTNKEILMEPVVDVPLANDLLTAFPWLRVLSEEAVAEFRAELMATVQSSAQAGDLDSVIAAVTAWKITADTIADPELYAVLSAPSDGDFGAVPKPGVGTEGRGGSSACCS